VALAAFALLLYLIDVRGFQRGLLPFRVFGTNAIVAFVLSGVITTLLIGSASVPASASLAV